MTDLIRVVSETIEKEVEDKIVFQVQLKVDTQATAQSIIERLQYADKLEKALDKACEVLEEVYVPSCDSDVRRHNRSAEEWKEWCMKDE